jgi:hypothetical protein
MHAIQLSRFMIDGILLGMPSIKWNIPKSHPTEVPLTRAEQTTKNRQNYKWELFQEIQIAH